ncbi:hypothetical protein SOVF_154840 [Spinacia oleracea]|nr:hypothetical protein SOVF_154840 [Spinacia oleracea]
MLKRMVNSWTRRHEKFGLIFKAKNLPTWRMRILKQRTSYFWKP